MDIVNYLISKGADAGKANNQTDTPLLIAAREGHAKVVSTLLKHLKTEEINHRNRSGETAFSLAVSRLNVDAVKVLLETDGIDRFLPPRTKRELKRKTESEAREIEKLLENKKTSNEK